MTSRSSREELVGSVPAARTASSTWRRREVVPMRPGRRSRAWARLVRDTTFISAHSSARSTQSEPVVGNWNLPRRALRKQLPRRASPVPTTIMRNAPQQADAAAESADVPVGAVLKWTRTTSFWDAGATTASQCDGSRRDRRLARAAASAPRGASTGRRSMSPWTVRDAPERVSARVARVVLRCDKSQSRLGSLFHGANHQLDRTFAVRRVRKEMLQPFSAPSSQHFAGKVDPARLTGRVLARRIVRPHTARMGFDGRHRRVASESQQSSRERVRRSARDTIGRDLGEPSMSSSVVRLRLVHQPSS